MNIVRYRVFFVLGLPLGTLMPWLALWFWAEPARTRLGNECAQMRPGILDLGP